MRKCPYCAEEIQDEAIKCKHCASILIAQQPEKWFFRTSTLVIAFLCIGPLALPLFWLNPRFSPKAKIVISLIIIALSYFLAVALFNSLKSISNYYKLI